MARGLIPKGCWVRYIDLTTKGRAEVRYECDAGNYQTRRESTHVKANEVSFRGAHFSGGRVDFVLIPANAVCTKSGAKISCKLKGDTSSQSLSGLKRRRRR